MEDGGKLDDITKRIDELCAEKNTLDDLKKAVQELVHGKHNGRSKSEPKDVKVNISETKKSDTSELRTASFCESNASARKQNTHVFSKINRVHPFTTEKRNTLRQVAKINQSALAVSSHIARLKHEKPQPKDLSTQYDQKLKHLFLTQWPDAVPQYNREQMHCCCCQSCCCCCQPCYPCYDPERVKHTRKLFKRVFPSFIFYFLVFTGAIPAGSKKCNILLNIFWYLIAAWYFSHVGTNIYASAAYFSCFREANCINYMKSNINYAVYISFAITDLSVAMTTLLVPTYLRRRFQSRELQTLISSIGPGRVGGPTYWWIIVFVVYIVTVTWVAIEMPVHGVQSNNIPYAVYGLCFFLPGASQFACLVFFLLVYRSTSLSYDDWTTKMISVVTAHPLRDATESQARLIQNNFLENLKARVSSSALVTRHAVWLLVSPLIALLGIVFMFVALITKRNVSIERVTLEIVLVAVFLPIPLVVIPMLMSARVDILENIVASASLRKISRYLEHAPTGWMMTQKTRLSIALLATSFGAISVVTYALNILIEYQSKAVTVPWDSQYDPFGSCSDGIRSGLEQHIDCGGPESSCMQTCREKYGEYILIPATRDCTDVDGYVHITTQRACSTAYNSWSRQNNRSVVHHAKVFEGVLEFPEVLPVSQIPLSDTWQHADWTNGFRCGATTFDKYLPGISVSENISTFSSAASFPALFSSWNPSFGIQQPLAYLCYAEDPRSQAKTHPEDSAHFEEAMACPGPVQHKWFASAWRNISGPRPIPSTNWRQSVSVAEFRAGRDNDGDCAEIRLHALGIGSQVVFALECNVSAYVDTNTSASGGLSGHDGPGIACPEGDRVRLAVQSTAVPRGALVVYPEANSTSGTRYTFESKQQTVLVSPGSTLIVVMDQSSNSMNVRLCF